MIEKLKVENEPIYRDVESNALIFTNKTEIEQYEAKRRKKQQKEDALKNEINMLKEDISELKTMIEMIFNKLQG